jgi:hypothetical protein
MRSLDAIISAALVTRSDVELVSPSLRACVTGIPYDERRLQGFSDLVTQLQELPPDVAPSLPAVVGRRRLLPFYEAYFSNFIEGTEFTVDEAAEIVFDGKMPEGRPQDAHDVLGTYEIVRDGVEMATLPRSGDGLLELLRARHAVLLDSRPEKNPGRFKTRANRAGLDCLFFLLPVHLLRKERLRVALIIWNCSRIRGTYNTLPPSPGSTTLRM